MKEKDNDLKDFLFKELQSDGKPLFRNQTELAQKILAFNVDDYKNEGSLRVYVNRVLNGEKNASKKFKSNLLMAIRNRTDLECYGTVKEKFLKELSKLTGIHENELNTGDDVSSYYSIESIANGYVYQLLPDGDKTYSHSKQLQEILFEAFQNLETGQKLIIELV